MKGPSQRAWSVAVAIGLGLSAATAAEASGPKTAVASSMVEFNGGAGPIKGYLARPNGEGPFPAIVIIHEWWGLADWIKQNADRLAGLGYVALAVDLYGGKATNDPAEAHELMRALDESDAVADLKGGVAYLKELPFVAQDQKCGVIGWCMGGNYARLLAQAADAIGPTVICYGSISAETAQVTKLQGKPILGIFGQEDRGIPPAKVEQFRRALLDRSNAKVDIHLYKGAGHGFMRPGGPQHNAAAATDAWQKIDAFFATNLKQ